MKIIKNEKTETKKFQLSVYDIADYIEHKLKNDTSYKDIINKKIGVDIEVTACIEDKVDKIVKTGKLKNLIAKSVIKLNG
jgi:hypothetical protein